MGKPELEIVRKNKREAATPHHAQKRLRRSFRKGGGKKEKIGKLPRISSALISREKIGPP